MSSDSGKEEDSILRDCAALRELALVGRLVSIVLVSRAAC